MSTSRTLWVTPGFRSHLCARYAPGAATGQTFLLGPATPGDDVGNVTSPTGGTLHICNEIT
jgi:hypothetical protein